MSVQLPIFAFLTEIGSAARSINRNLDESGLFGDVSQNELRGISTTLRKLSPRQTHDAISQLPDVDLDTWMDEVGSRGLFGTGGLSADDRSDLFSDLHASLGTGQIARIYHAAGDTGMQYGCACKPGERCRYCRFV